MQSRNELPDTSSEDWLQRLSAACPTLKVDPDEGCYYVVDEFAKLYTALMPDSQRVALNSVFEEMANGSPADQNLLVLGILERIADNPESRRVALDSFDIKSAELLKKVIRGWK